MARPHESAESMRLHGLSLPASHEDHPWGESVLKVKGKVFVFFGRESDDVLRFSVKLPGSGERWLDQPCAEPTGYGLGKSGWVTFTFDARDVLPATELRALIDESYRAVAPKSVLKALDGAASAAPRPRAARATARPQAAKARPKG